MVHGPAERQSGRPGRLPSPSYVAGGSVALPERASRNAAASGRRGDARMRDSFRPASLQRRAWPGGALRRAWCAGLAARRLGSRSGRGELSSLLRHKAAAQQASHISLYHHCRAFTAAASARPSNVAICARSRVMRLTRTTDRSAGATRQPEPCSSVASQRIFARRLPGRRHCGPKAQA